MYLKRLPSCINDDLGSLVAPCMNDEVVKYE